MKMGQSITSFVRRLVQLLAYLLRLAWVREIFQLVVEMLRNRARGDRVEDQRWGRDPHCRPKCGVVRPENYRRADPLIYSQRWLRSQGLAVTWNNPDIVLYRDGVAVSSSELEADTEYEVRATVWNNSTDAPAVDMPVEFSYLDFGIGPDPIPFGTDVVTVPVKGAAGHPATAARSWRTPDRPGHYCLQVNLVWADDANPDNNLGQENTNVGAATSPALFRFPVRNEYGARRLLELVADSYEIPEQRDCSEPELDDREQAKRSNKAPSKERAYTARLRSKYDRAADWQLARLRHDPGRFPVPAGWIVDFSEQALDLAANETRDVDVRITPPDDFLGEQVINVHGIHAGHIVGGVTLTVTKA